MGKTPRADGSKGGAFFKVYPCGGVSTQGAKKGGEYIEDHVIDQVGVKYGSFKPDR